MSKVLVICSAPDRCLHITMMLRENSVPGIVSCAPEAARNTVEMCAPQMLVVDMGSNEQAAFELIAMLRRNLTKDHLPAVLLAGHDASKVKSKLDDVIILKGSPLDAEGLLTTVMLHVQPHHSPPAIAASAAADAVQPSASTPGESTPLLRI